MGRLGSGVACMAGMALVCGLVLTGCSEDEATPLSSSSQSSLLSSLGSSTSSVSGISSSSLDALSSSSSNTLSSSAAASSLSVTASSVQSSSLAVVSSTSSLASASVFTIPRGIKNASLLCKDGKAWVAWQSTNDNGFYLAEYNPVGPNWSDAGGKIADGSPMGWVAPSLVLNAAGTLLVGVPVYVDGSTINNKVWTWNGSVFSQLGLSLNTGISYHVQLENRTNGIFAIWNEVGNGMKVSLSLYNQGTASWQSVGTPLFSAGGAYTPSLAFDSSNKPWVAFQDYTLAPSYDATVMAYDELHRN